MPLRILVTNDDGINSPFLAELVRALQPLGELFVVAPRHEQSWISKAISRNRAVAHACSQLFSCQAWDIDGTPSDCVNIALHHLLPAQPDVIVSGINIGLNAGLPFILGSGTVAGALEGAFHGLPAIALSQDLTPEEFRRLHESKKAELSPTMAETLRASATRAAGWVGQLIEESPPGRCLVHNINFPFPNAPDTPAFRTIPSKVILGPLFAPACPETFAFKFSLGQIEASEALTDRACLAAGHISHSILAYDQLGLP